MRIYNPQFVLPIVLLIAAGCATPESRREEARQAAQREEKFARDFIASAIKTKTNKHDWLLFESYNGYGDVRSVVHDPDCEECLRRNGWIEVER